MLARAVGAGNAATRVEEVGGKIRVDRILARGEAVQVAGSGYSAELLGQVADSYDDVSLGQLELKKGNNSLYASVPCTALTAVTGLTRVVTVELVSYRFIDLRSSQVDGSIDRISAAIIRFLWVNARFWHDSACVHQPHSFVYNISLRKDRHP